MRTGRFLACLSVFLVAGCAAAGMTAGPQVSAGSSLRSTIAAPDSSGQKDTWLYVAGSTNNTIYVYDVQKPGNPLVSTIIQGINTPRGITVGPKGKLFVTNGNGTVTSYPFGESIPDRSIDLANAYAPAVNPTNSRLYVATRGSPPGIAVYKVNQPTPFRFIVNPLITAPGQMVFDSFGDLFIADNLTGVLEIKAGGFRVKSLNLNGLSSCTSGVALDDATGNLYVSGCSSGILMYTLGSTDPSMNLSVSFPAQFIAIGAAHNVTDLWAGDSASDTVSAWHEATINSFLSFTTGAHNALGVAIKPAGVPPPK